MYKTIRELLEAGYEVNLRPDNEDNVTLSVTEAKNGSVECVEVKLGIMEWAFAEAGITERLEGARNRLIGRPLC